MDDSTFSALRSMIHGASGICVQEGKARQLEARLRPRVRELGLKGYGEYLAVVKGDGSGTELDVLIDKVVNRVTHFFRESAHFDFLASAALDAAVRGRPRFRVWSAACATGEEPFSLAMLLKENLPSTLLETDILATDISRVGLEAGRRGVYDRRCLKDIPSVLRRSYLVPVQGQEGKVRVRDGLSAMVRFRRCNLVDLPARIERFDAILCRNVLIYFDPITRRQVLQRLIRSLVPHGYLILGHTESMMAKGLGLDLVRPSVYQVPSAQPIIFFSAS